MAEHSTRSGACLRIGRRAVRKTATTPTGAELLTQQAQYMRRVGAPFVPVRGILPGSYAMPRLVPWVATSAKRDTVHRLLDVRATAEQHLWRPTHRALPADWAKVHAHYMRKLFKQHRLSDLLWDRFSRRLDLIVQLGVHRNAEIIHGDLTLENTVTAPDSGDILFIDPLPNRPYIPNVRAVDLGKLLQSARGWEIHKDNPGASIPWNVAEAESAVFGGYGAAMRYAARYWYTVHCVRLLRYVSPSVQAFYIREAQNVPVCV